MLSILTPVGHPRNQSKPFLKCTTLSLLASKPEFIKVTLSRVFWKGRHTIDYEEVSKKILSVFYKDLKSLRLKYLNVTLLKCFTPTRHLKTNNWHIHTWYSSLAHLRQRLCRQGNITTGFVNTSRQMGQISCFSSVSNESLR